MPHLDPERLAALDHEGPSPEELAHLATCAACAQERLAFDRLATFARSHGETAADGAPPLTAWSTLSAQLRADGLITRLGDTQELAAMVFAPVVDAPLTNVKTPIGPPLRMAARDTLRARRSWSGVARIAAAVAFMTTGVAVGRASTGKDIIPLRTPLAAQPVSTDAAFGSVAEASSVLDRARRDYQRASLWLSSHDTTVNAQAVYRARLSALDQMMTASRAGLYEAPQDPVLNQYYLAAYTAREATLRQLGASLPVDRVMESF